ncbi:IS30 family transposas [Weissella oryzae SG25]|uniref:IS30 family transposas n=1 Tax=Weissella oryzae (strain DSM 25784 / JCM 18191 / LMG 30913 / SG25) TaxID=1329250 RepID=A0A069CXV1_WEIOS|nr:IS30 family transposase [Weissella oryzae]GAK32088.1 IS30 family transposas [Weissella oryzae SG25]
MESKNKERKSHVRRPHVSESERVMLEYLWNVEQLSQSEISKRLNRAQSVISRELYSGNVLDFSHLSRPELLRLPIHARIKYSATRGQFNATKKSFRFGQGNKLTPELKKLIEHWINDEKWTPEEISARIEDVNVSASTIRNWANRHELDIKIKKYHTNNRNERHRQNTIREKEAEIARLRSKLRENGELVRHSIYERPETINSRSRFGHWEIDLVLPAKNRDGMWTDKSAIMTIVERKTRFLAMYKIKSKRSDDVIAGFDKFLSEYGNLVRTITADNGIEFVSWDFLEHVQKEKNIKIYYATPSSPQQRGSNEFKNRNLRKYLPKGQTFYQISQAKLNDIMDKINRKPMLQALNGRSPIELFEKEYRKLENNKRAYSKRKLISNHVDNNEIMTKDNTDILGHEN